MSDDDRSRYETRVETNRWESFTRLTFTYFADQDYDVEQDVALDEGGGTYELRFTDEERGEEAVFVYEGNPYDMAQENLQTMQKLFEESATFSNAWTDMLDQAGE